MIDRHDEVMNRRSAVVRKRKILHITTTTLTVFVFNLIAVWFTFGNLWSMQLAIILILVGILGFGASLVIDLVFKNKLVTEAVCQKCGWQDSASDYICSPDESDLAPRKTAHYLREDSSIALIEEGESSV